MKKMTMALAAVAILTTACTNETIEPINNSQRITFALTGDFSLQTHDFTRSLTADGKYMTDVWVLDYVGGTLQQQLHQTSADTDFGMPTMDLSIGTHHIYFVASRGQSPTLSTENHTLTFGKVLDTFYKDYELTISGGTSASAAQSVTLERIVTKLKVTFTDAIPSTASTFNITPASWHYGFDYLTGNPTTATVSQNIVVNIPSSSVGKAGESINVFGFSGTTEWTTNVTINCQDAGSTVLGSATITAAPFVRNRVSEYSGPLFATNGSMTLSLNADWLDTYLGVW